MRLSQEEKNYTMILILPSIDEKRKGGGEKAGEKASLIFITHELIENERPATGVL